MVDVALLRDLPGLHGLSAAGPFLCAELGSRLELGRALYTRGRMQDAQGNLGSARADVTRAHAIFAATGARRDLDRAALYLSGLNA